MRIETNREARKTILIRIISVPGFKAQHAECCIGQADAILKVLALEIAILE